MTVFTCGCAAPAVFLFPPCQDDRKLLRTESISGNNRIGCSRLYRTYPSHLMQSLCAYPEGRLCHRRPGTRHLTVSRPYSR
jgi:hypothetical protein